MATTTTIPRLSAPATSQQLTDALAGTVQTAAVTTPTTAYAVDVATRFYARPAGARGPLAEPEPAGYIEATLPLLDGRNIPNAPAEWLSITLYRLGNGYAWGITELTGTELPAEVVVPGPGLQAWQWDTPPAGGSRDNTTGQMSLTAQDSALLSLSELAKTPGSYILLTAPATEPAAHDLMMAIPVAGQGFGFYNHDSVIARLGDANNIPGLYEGSDIRVGDFAPNMKIRIRVADNGNDMEVAGSLDGGASYYAPSVQVGFVQAYRTANLPMKLEAHRLFSSGLVGYPAVQFFNAPA